MKGFTLIELLVVMGIFLLLTGGILVNYNNFNDVQSLKQVAATLKSNLRLAQAQTLSGQKPTGSCTELVGYSIGITGNSYSIQALCSPEGLVGTPKTVTLPTGISLSTQPNTPTLQFQVWPQGVAIPSSVQLTFTGFAKSYVLELSPSGDINDLGFQ